MGESTANRPQMCSSAGGRGQDALYILSLARLTPGISLTCQRGGRTTRNVSYLASSKQFHQLLSYFGTARLKLC
jgi:hypothetical protein